MSAAAAGRNRGYGRSTNRAGNQAPAALPDATKPVRVTLDLRPGMHKKLKKWCNLTAAEQELSRVDLSVVLRVMAEELLENDSFAEHVAKKLKQGEGQL